MYPFSLPPSDFRPGSPLSLSGAEGLEERTVELDEGMGRGLNGYEFGQFLPV